ncbi:hypothetical protein ABW19_dt0209695 [Dactylella cylindrospora]|nr:hypothetical protein ABW19_dt0209695 [Dactylella cylindrospora]
MDSLPYPRPMSAAARAAAMRAKFEGAGVSVGPKMPSAAAAVAARFSGGGSSQATYLLALDKLSATTQKWLDSLEQLTENAVKQQKKLKAEDPASSDERVHKMPLHKVVAARKKQAEDVVMKDAPVVTESQADAESGKSVGSNDRIRPSTPTNMPKLDQIEPSVPIQRQPISRPPISPPAIKFEDMEIKSPQNAASTREPTKEPLPPIADAPAKDDSKPGFFRPPFTTHTSIASIPPTPPTLVTPPVVTPSEIPSIKEPVPTVVTPGLEPLTAPSETSLTVTQSEGTLSVKSESVSTSSTKKRRLSSKTILDSLMEKKARNPIWYDGVAQKAFYDMVFEMSQQIQSMKRERRIVMFAKDPTCGNLLDALDNLLQKSLKTVELSSFLFLKGKPDLREIEGLKTELKSSIKDIEEFKKSGWSMNTDEDSDSENDDEDESD